MVERYVEQLERLVSYIEKNLKGALSLDALSREAGLSKYHLHRVFRLLTGYSLGEYVRRRRISESLSDLLGSGKSILDIALCYGFSWEQSYGRAFRSIYGISPGQCRDDGQMMRYSPRIDFSGITGVGFNGACISSHPIMMPSITLCGILHTFQHSEDPSDSTIARLATDFMKTHASQIGPRAELDKYWGVDFSHTKGSAEKNKAFLTSVKIRGREPLSVPAGMTLFTVSCAPMTEFVHTLRVHPSQCKRSDFDPLRAQIRISMLNTERAVDWSIECIDLKSARKDFGEYRYYLPMKSK